MFNLIINYFECGNSQRQKEYDLCLRENLKNEHISKIFLFSTTKKPPNHDKIRVLSIPKEPSVQDMLSFANKSLIEQPCIIANSDIVFDNTLSEIGDLSGLFLALTRWEEDVYGKKLSLYNPPWGSEVSQDSWIFKSPFVPCERLGFPLGFLGADGRLSFVANKSGLKVINPSKIVITRHIHTCNYRTRAKTKRVYGEYLFVEPSNFFKTPSYYRGAKMTDGKVIHTRIKSNR